MGDALERETDGLACVTKAGSLHVANGRVNVRSAPTLMSRRNLLFRASLGLCDAHP